MSAQRLDDDSRQLFSFEHNAEYRRVQLDFLSAVKSLDPSGLAVSYQSAAFCVVFLIDAAVGTCRPYRAFFLFVSLVCMLSAVNCFTDSSLLSMVWLFICSYVFFGGQVTQVVFLVPLVLCNLKYLFFYISVCCCCCCRPHSTNVLPAESSTRIIWQPTVSPPRWQGKAPLCRDSSRGPG